MEKLLFVFLGGGVGSLARYGGGVASTQLFGARTGWPAILTVNIAGGFLMGALVAALALRGGADQERFRLLLAVGVLGGFTTVSSFSLDAVRMIETRAYGAAAGYIVASVSLSIAALFAGMLAGEEQLTGALSWDEIQDLLAG